jgi:transcriptional regulator of aromatic amino acid metabolism
MAIEKSGIQDSKISGAHKHLAEALNSIQKATDALSEKKDIHKLVQSTIKAPSQTGGVTVSPSQKNKSGGKSLSSLTRKQKSLDGWIKIIQEKVKFTWCQLFFRQAPSRLRSMQIESSSKLELAGQDHRQRISSGDTPFPMQPLDHRSPVSSQNTAHSPTIQGTIDALMLDGGGPRKAEPLHNWSHLFPEIIGRSPAMQRVLEAAFKVARSDSSILILGESGTGKELIATAIHRLSSRAKRAYVPVNCSGVPDNLLESDLFGHEMGSIARADRRQGKFECAEGGTIFLDEIGDMSPPIQTKLLRILQDKKFAPLGGNELKEANVRIITATNKNLQQAVREGIFRLDLYYRLNVLPISIPPLRERAEDIPDLLQYFMNLANRTHGVGSPSYLTPDLLGFLCQYPWPGNVRQLRNVVEHLVIMRSGGALSLGDLPCEMLE